MSTKIKNKVKNKIIFRRKVGDDPDDPDMVLYKYVPSSIINEVVDPLSHDKEDTLLNHVYGASLPKGVLWCDPPSVLGGSAVNPDDTESTCVNGMRFWALDAFGNRTDASMEEAYPAFGMPSGSVFEVPIFNGDSDTPPCCITPYNYCYKLSDKYQTTWRVHPDDMEEYPLSFGYSDGEHQKSLDLFFSPFVYGPTKSTDEAYVHSGNWLYNSSNMTPTFCVSHASVFPLLISDVSVNSVVFGSADSRAGSSFEVTSCVRELSANATHRRARSAKKKARACCVDDDVPKEILELGDKKLIEMYKEKVKKAKERGTNGASETCSFQCTLMQSLSTTRTDAYTQSNTGNFESDDKAGIYPFVPNYEASDATSEVPSCNAVPIHIYTSGGAAVDFGDHDDDTKALFSFLQTVGGDTPIRASPPDDASKAQSISVSFSADFTWGGTFVVSPPCGVVNYEGTSDTYGPNFTWLNFDESTVRPPTYAQAQSATCYLDVYPCLMASLYKPSDTDDENNCLRTGVLLNDPVLYKQTHVVGVPKRMDYEYDENEGASDSRTSLITIDIIKDGEETKRIPCFPTPLNKAAHITTSITAYLPDKLPHYDGGKLLLKDIDDDTPVYLYVVLSKVLRAEVSPSYISENMYITDMQRKRGLSTDEWVEGVQANFTDDPEGGELETENFVQWGYVSGLSNSGDYELISDGNTLKPVAQSSDCSMVFDNMRMSYTINSSHNDVTFS